MHAWKSVIFVFGLMITLAMPSEGASNFLEARQRWGMIETLRQCAQSGGCVSEAADVEAERAMIAEELSAQIGWFLAQPSPTQSNQMLFYQASASRLARSSTDPRVKSLAQAWLQSLAQR